MIIEKILKQLTPGRTKKEIEAVKKIKLPPELQRWVNEYGKVGDRNNAIWLFTYRIIQIFSFPVVKKHKKSLWEIKFLITMFVILLDDMVDKAKNKKLINELLNILFGRKHLQLRKVRSKDKEYLKFASKIWDYIKKTIKRYPRFREFEDIFQHDIFQILIAMNFTFLVNKSLYLINKTEYWAYSPYPMQSMVYCTLDLMCAPKFNIKELSSIREMFWHAQKMARIGNWISTWEREIRENDFTSGVFVYAIDSNLFSVNELKKEKESEIINKIKNSKIEEKLLREWEGCYNKLTKFSKKIKSVNVGEFLFKMRKLIIMHLTIRNI